jgi:DNA-binding transcriptional LysR family regulator
MDKLRGMAVFTTIVDKGSLTAAAEALGLSGPTVVRSLALLERAVGVRLINRTTRRSSLTDEGREYYERCKRVLAEAEAADASLTARRSEPHGRLRITAPVLFGRLHVAPVVNAFLARHAGVEVELLLFDRVVDLVEEGIDVGVRIGKLAESTLVALPAGQTRRVLCASPQWLKRHGVPRVPQALSDRPCIVFTGLGSANEWRFAGARSSVVQIRPVLRTNQIDTAIEACVHGLGCAQFLSYQVESHLAKGHLKRVLTAFEPPSLPVQVVYPSARLVSANVRAFVDLLLPRLRERAGV